MMTARGWGDRVAVVMVRGQTDRQRWFCVSQGSDLALGGLTDLLQPREPSVWLLWKTPTRPAWNAASPVSMVTKATALINGCSNGKHWYRRRGGGGGAIQRFTEDIQFKKRLFSPTLFAGPFLAHGSIVDSLFHQHPVKFSCRAEAWQQFLYIWNPISYLNKFPINRIAEKC